MACRQQPRGARPESRVYKCRGTTKYDTIEGHSLTRAMTIGDSTGCDSEGYCNTLKQSPCRGKIGHAHVKHGLDRSETHRARAHELGQSLSLTESDDSRKILLAVRGDRVDIATLATTSAAQQKRKPNWRMAVRRLTLATVDDRSSRRTSGRE